MLKKVFSRFFRCLFILNKNIKLHGKVSIIGKPIVNIKDNCLLEIGNSVKLNSSNSKYHVNLFSPVKIYIYGQDAKVELGNNTRIHGSCLNAAKYIKIGDNCLIAGNCQIFDNSGHDMYKANMLDVSDVSKEVIIEDNVWIGTGSIILPGTIIKSGSVIAAGSVVRGEYECNSLIGGNPAKLIKIINKVE